MTPTLDDRLAAGAAGLRRTVGAVPPPAPPRPPSPGPRVLAALVLVAALVAGAAVALRSGGDDGSDVAMSSGELPTLVSTDPPAGLALSIAYDQETVEDADPPFDTLAADMVVYGDADADDPFAERDLEVRTRTIPPGGEMTGDEDGTTSGPVTVRGRPGLGGVYGDASTEAGLRFLQWTESDTLLVRVASYSLSEDELAAVAAALVVDDGVARLAEAPAGVAGPLDEVGSRHRDDYAGPGAPREHIAYYVPGGGEPTGEPGTASAMTTVLPGGEAELAALRWELGPGEAVEVDGRDGWLATDRLAADPAGGDDPAVVMSLVWARSEGVLVRIDTAHLAADDGLALAESLDVVPADEWARLVAANELLAVDDDPADELTPVGETTVDGVTLDD
jgi:hypothetical protein